jgi:hypothetical protein
MSEIGFNHLPQEDIDGLERTLGIGDLECEIVDMEQFDEMVTEAIRKGWRPSHSFLSVHPWYKGVPPLANWKERMATLTKPMDAPHTRCERSEYPDLARVIRFALYGSRLKRKAHRFVREIEHDHPHTQLYEFEYERLMKWALKGGYSPPVAPEIPTSRKF